MNNNPEKNPQTGITRRDFLKSLLLTAVAGLAGGCNTEQTQIEKPWKEESQTKPSFIKKEDGSVDIPPETLQLLDDLKNKFPVDQWNQYGEGGTFNGVEVTAGDNRQAFIALDLWRQDGKTPWGNGEIKTIVYWGGPINSIGLKKNFRGTGWVYPQDLKGNGWNIEWVTADSAAGIQRRINNGENIADVMIMPLGNTNNYILVNSKRQPLIIDGKIAWQGKIKEDEKAFVGIRGMIPLSVLIDIELAQPRNKK